MRHIQFPTQLAVEAPPRAIPMNTGHYRLADGSLLRVDLELGRCVGRLYTPEMNVKTQIRGSAAMVHAWADEIVAGHPKAPNR